MSADLSIANLNLIPAAEEIVSETSKPKLTTLLKRSEEVLRKALGDDEETIANSLRGL